MIDVLTHTAPTLCAIASVSCLGMLALGLIGLPVRYLVGVLVFPPIAYLGAVLVMAL